MKIAKKIETDLARLYNNTHIGYKIDKTITPSTKKQDCSNVISKGVKTFIIRRPTRYIII